jgi:DNA polymerase III alpha subunit
MINLKCRTEFSFHEVFGPIPRVLDRTQGPVGIADRTGTWGHCEFYRLVRAAGRKPLLGAEIAFVEDRTRKEKQGINHLSFFARNAAGLRELYELVSESTEPENFYYVPRLDYSRLLDLSDNLVILSGPSPLWGSLPRHPYLFVELSPVSSRMALTMARKKKMEVVATSDNFYPSPEDRSVYEVFSGRMRQQRTAPMHLLTEDEWQLEWPEAPRAALENQQLIADLCSVELPRASMVHFDSPTPLRKLCELAAPARGINLRVPAYRDRLKRELDMIAEKDFADYFYLVADMIRWAKKKMLVGPARGSSCGSLVCYLLSITEIDPLKYGLLFERFIDINRKDLPDIDIDFPDDRREMVFDYLREKYGADCVARLGTVMRYKAKSAITDISKELNIPSWEVADLKNAIIERSTGDSRAAFCILDTFEQLEIGRKTLERYPQLRVAGMIENHAKGKGQHAAGIVVTASPVSEFCSVDRKIGACQLDKHDAETVNLLKIDALGLRTLSVIQDCLDQISWTREQLINYRTNDAAAFDILNRHNFAGVFQFEGWALQSLCQQMRVENFEDIVALTALARPGPLDSGGASEYIRRRTGEVPTTHLHPSIEPITRVSYGIVIYQEQVMRIARDMGRLSWEDVSSLRKAMSKSLGKEFFDQYWVRFREGAKAQGIKEEDAKLTWDSINTMGSWSFNRSHAVAYGMVSYWTLVLKAHFPLQYAAACLRNARDDDQVTAMLRELRREGFRFCAFDAERSGKNWTVRDGELLGGLLQVRGIGEKTADDILQRRQRGEPLTASQRSKIANAETPFDSVFQCEQFWGHIRQSPAEHGIKSRIWDIRDITMETEGTVLIFGKLKKKDLRDLNDTKQLEKRKGRRISGQSLYLNLTVEDDSGLIVVTIDRHAYLRWGKPIVETAKLGDWFLWKGTVRKGWQRVMITRWRKLEIPVDSCK